MIIATVVEGPTDRLVLEAIIRKLIPGDHRFLPLQPSATFGEMGTGWKGVKRWCEQSWQLPGSSLEALLTAVQPPIDLLVIHVDADVADEGDLQENTERPVASVLQPCPPAGDTAARLIFVIQRWLKRDVLPPQVIFAIPAQDTEYWTFAALFPQDRLCANADYECRKDHKHAPGYLLTRKQYDKVLTYSGGHVKKTVAAYRDLADKVAAAWDGVCLVCVQAQGFTDEVMVHAERPGQ